MLATRRFILGISMILVLFQMAPRIAAGQDSGGKPPGLGLKNTGLIVTLSVPISTRTSREGDAFSAQILSPAQYAGATATVEGRIKQVTAAHRGKKASISFAFETLTIRGETHLIQAELKAVVSNSKGVKGVDEEGQVIGVKSNKKKIGGAVAGAGIGALIGAVGGGAQGAAVGAGSGAAVGLLLAMTLTTSGSNVEFFPGTQFSLVASDRRR